MYGMFNCAAGNSKIHHVIGLVIVKHRINQSGSKGVTSAHPIQNMKGEQFTPFE